MRCGGDGEEEQVSAGEPASERGDSAERWLICARLSHAERDSERVSSGLSILECDTARRLFGARKDKLEFLKKWDKNKNDRQCVTRSRGLKLR